MKASKIALAVGCAIAAKELIKAGRRFDLNDALGRFGLERRHTSKERIVPAVSFVGLGALVGAGVALFVAPSSGEDLRSRLSDRLDRAKHRMQRGRRGRSDVEQYSTAGNGTNG